MDVSDRNATRRSCRAYRLRLVDTIRKASATWGYLHEVKAPRFEPVSETCMDLSKEAKAYLAACPIKDQQATFAWNSIKKLQPTSCRCMEAPLIFSVANQFKSAPPSLPPGYLSFVKRVTREMFPFGWDTHYERDVLSVDPPISGCEETPRSWGGVHGFSTNGSIKHCTSTTGSRPFVQSEFVDACLHGVDRKLSTRSFLTVVQSAGKPRPLSKFSADAIHLKPLHKAIYDRISGFSWLNRGDFTSDGLRGAGFSFVEGELLFSGDYKSATDNLSIEVAEAILSTLLSTTVSVPGSIKHYAMSILRPILFNLELDIDDFSPSRGQMMGSLLSFPLLCIQNRLAFLWAGHSVGIDCSDFPCLINGDDILFRSGPHFGAHWMDTVSSLSLEVEKTKTSVSASYGSLNSTLCVRRGRQYVVVPTVRMGMLRESESLDSLATGFNEFIKGLKGSYRYRAAMAWFSWNIGKIRPLGLTTFDLGFRGPLAYRATKKFKLSTNLTHQPVPSLRIENGLSLEASGCLFEDPDLLSAEDKEVNLLELAAWKWRTKFVKSERSDSEMKLCLAVSALRRDEPDFKPLIWGSESGSCTRALLSAKLFNRRILPRKRGFPVMCPVRGLLPSYEDSLAEEVDVGSVEPKSKMDTKG
ncbi:RNA dependent RNA polymerase [Plasmopara viticola lesion associated ourmia-like virus 77]|uniref:RNA dependent RNA polymerase n=1 Tax=Plasmopara viticola lesion associated ourmia-like virus 77 TaxID=2686550 RepID=A0ABX6FJZ4_9VIRU|nr:RNA dependent RNA polymerase [Plasmopara viticola lesion associated ourmia-like virus 77]QGY72607.1 RNA dependent RNA polymerase [Plasmopara viticola lesion associated ourmia-like virus 77]